METQTEIQDPILSSSDLSSIYKSISIEPTGNFDELNENQFLENCIENCYDKTFKLIDSKELLKDITQLNNSFVILIHYCNNNYKYKNVSKMFIAYCDYFSLNHHSVYVVLHDKLQTLIKHGFIKLIGGLKNFSLLKNKYDPVVITTVFDLVSNKKL